MFACRISAQRPYALVREGQCSLSSPPPFTRGAGGFRGWSPPSFSKMGGGTPPPFLRKMVGANPFRKCGHACFWCIFGCFYDLQQPQNPKISFARALSARGSLSHFFKGRTHKQCVREHVRLTLCTVFVAVQRFEKIWSISGTVQRSE